MAKVYSAPIPAPVFKYETWQKDSREYKEKLAEYFKKEKPNDKAVGKVIQFGVADGYTQYMVASMKPLQLVHLDLMDGYAIPQAHARGLTAKDVREQIANAEAMNKLFNIKEQE